MEIRKKLAYQFIGIVALILLIALLAIYLSFSKSRKEEFYDRMDSKAKQAAQMLMDIDEIDAELLKKIEKNNPLNLANEKIVIYDYRNRIIFSSDTDNTLRINLGNVNEARTEGEVKLRQSPYEILGQSYGSGHERIVVFVGARDIFGLKKLKYLRLILISVYFISLIIVYFAGKLFAARALAPISRIIREVDGISIYSLDQRLDEGNGLDELARLARTFNNMLQRLETSFQIQKNFIANASHELRTPLTVVTGQIEVTLLNARKNDEYIQTLQSVLEDMKNLNNLANRLLLLAQTSSDLTSINFGPVRIDDALWQARNDLIRRRKEYVVEISFSDEIDDEKKFIVEGNEVLFRTAISNLLDNACKYSQDHKALVNIGISGKELCIDVEDHGIGIPENEISMIFQPFFRSSNAIKTRGHGIGLSIVDRIVQLHKGRIQVISALNGGTSFRVYLPLLNS